MSEFLVICIPHDEGGLEIVVDEYDTAMAAQDAVMVAKEHPAWREVIQIYRHPGVSPLANKWWSGLSTVYERRNRTWEGAQ